MRRKQEPVVLQLSPDCNQALTKLEDDTATVVELLHELIETQHAVLSQLRAEVESATGAEVNGEVAVEPFTDAPVADWGGISPDAGSTAERESPFRRAPRRVQVAWLQRVMRGGGWYTAYSIANRYATDERHRRYMRSAVTGRLREMYEDGQVDRRDSTERGSMFEYRLKEAAGA